jgi:hypothetical protein
MHQSYIVRLALTKRTPAVRIGVVEPMSLFEATRPYLIKIILGASFSFFTLETAASDDGWHSGRLLQHSSASREVVHGYGKDGPVMSIMEVDDGSHLYFMQCTAWMDWSKVPSLTDQSLLRFRVKGQRAYIKDDLGVSFRLKIQRIETKTSLTQ